MDCACFAYRKNEGCTVLDVFYCSGETCSFYKTDLQQQKECEAARARLFSLDRFMRAKIADKYYNGLL